MQYLLDTVTIIRHFSESGHIGKRAKKLLSNGNNTFIISVISLMEIMYLSEKKRIEIDLVETINKLENSSLYIISELNTEILVVAANLGFYELHDRLILSTAKWLDIPVISSDKAFKSVDNINVIWD